MGIWSMGLKEKTRLKVSECWMESDGEEALD